jgi:hypothetical protein
MSENRRPTSITLLVLLILGLALWNGLRLGQAIFFWKTLQEYGASPWYIVISGGFWLLGGLALAWGARRGKPWAWAGTIGSMIGYGSWYWFDRLVLQVPHANWPFSLAFTILLAGCLALILLSPKTRAYFNKKETSHD